jgi:N-dimethylarginine dimethylaminohydrolase
MKRVTNDQKKGKKTAFVEKLKQSGVKIELTKPRSSLSPLLFKMNPA